MNEADLIGHYPRLWHMAEDGSFESGAIESGQQRALLFSKPGTFPFHCTPHPFMKGVVVVTAQ